MNKFFMIIIMALFTSITQADDYPQTNIEVQDNDQKLCIQKTIENCMQQCNKDKAVDCSDACTENAKNECLHAGE